MQVSGEQCGQAEVHHNTCLSIKHNKKLSFSDSRQLCRDNNMSLLHNHTVQGGLGSWGLGGPGRPEGPRDQSGSALQI